LEDIEELDRYISTYVQNSEKIKYKGYESSPGIVYEVQSNLIEAVRQRLREINYEAPIELLKDLFIYHCEESAKVWGCYKHLGEIGQALIEKSKTIHVIDYLIHSQDYFDCMIASGQVQWEEALVVEIRDYLEELQITETDEKIIAAINFGLNRRFGLHHINNPKIKKYLNKPIKRRLRKK